jgi:uncharacterized protein
MLSRLFMCAALAALTGFAPLEAGAGNPSFDCEGAKYSIEKMICDDETLSALDVEVAKAFARAIARAPANLVQDMRTTQTSWRRQMLRCEMSSDAHACTLQAYESRLTEF